MRSPAVCPLDVTRLIVHTMILVTTREGSGMRRARPSELELQVLAVLWDRGPSSVRAVLEAMPDGKERAYTTILSVMQMLEKKGLVGHTQQGQANVYRPLARRDQVLRPLMKDLLRNV